MIESEQLHKPIIDLNVLIPAVVAGYQLEGFCQYPLLITLREISKAAFWFLLWQIALSILARPLNI